MLLFGVATSTNSASRHAPGQGELDRKSTCSTAPGAGWKRATTRFGSTASSSRRTGRSTEHLDYYGVLALLKFAVIMARIGLQMKHYELIPDDNEMDVHNLASLVLGRLLDELGSPSARRSP